MACHCPCIKCFDCNEYGHVAADCSDKYHHQVHLHSTEIIILARDTLLDPHLTIITETKTGLTGQDHIPSVTDTGVTARVIHSEVTAGHITVM